MADGLDGYGGSILDEGFGSLVGSPFSIGSSFNTGGDVLAGGGTSSGLPGVDGSFFGGGSTIWDVFANAAEGFGSLVETGYGTLQGINAAKREYQNSKKPGVGMEQALLIGVAVLVLVLVAK